MRVRRPSVHWFLPDEPDVLGGLRSQMAVTVAGMDAFAAWAAGDTTAAEIVRAKEHEADEARRALRAALRDAFITPISPEDVFILSQLLDKTLNGAKDVVREAEVMDMPPDAPMAEMAERLREGTSHLSRAFDAIAVDDLQDIALGQQVQTRTRPGGIRTVGDNLALQVGEQREGERLSREEQRLAVATDMEITGFP